jgi:molecular chaperone IbpA
MRNTMTSYDLTPLFRSSVGFDSLSRMLDSAMKIDETAPSYPPYNIERVAGDQYRITMAVAGFAPEDLTLTSQENTLLVQGNQQGKQQKAEKTDGQYLHRGIAARAFERRFQLADHIRVTGANLEHGLLHIDLVREVPEAMKPRVIEINNSGSNAKVIDQAKH